MSTYYENTYDITNIARVDVSDLPFNYVFVCGYMNFNAASTLGSMIEEEVCPRIHRTMADRYLVAVDKILPDPSIIVSDMIIMNEGRYFNVTCTNIKYQCVLPSSNYGRRYIPYQDDTYTIGVILPDQRTQVIMQTTDDTQTELSMDNYRNIFPLILSVNDEHIINSSVLVSAEHLSTQDRIVCSYVPTVTPSLLTSQITCLRVNPDIILEKYSNETHIALTCKISTDLQASRTCQPDVIELYIDEEFQVECPRSYMHGSNLDTPNHRNMQEGRTNNSHAIIERTACRSSNSNQFMFLHIVKRVSSVPQDSQVRCQTRNYVTDFKVIKSEGLANIERSACLTSMEPLRIIVLSHPHRFEIRCEVLDHCVDNSPGDLEDMAVQLFVSGENQESSTMSVATRQSDETCSTYPSNYVTCYINERGITSYINKSYVTHYRSFENSWEIGVMCFSPRFISVSYSDPIYRFTSVPTTTFTTPTTITTTSTTPTTTTTTPTTTSSTTMSITPATRSSITTPSTTITSSTTRLSTQTVPKLDLDVVTPLLPLTTTAVTTTTIFDNMNDVEKKGGVNVLEIMMSILCAIIGLLVIAVLLYILLRRSRRESMDDVDYLKTFLRKSD